MDQQKFVNSLIEEVLDGSFNLLVTNLGKKVAPISSSNSLRQSGIIDRENKSELKKSREAMERIEGEPSGIIDI